jgi:mycothiol system anti-sigma-R factor
VSHCDDAIHDVYSYLDREMNWYRAWKIRRHISACGSCEGAFTFEERLLVVIKERLHEEVPPEFLERLRQALASEA